MNCRLHATVGEKKDVRRRKRRKRRKMRTVESVCMQSTDS